MAAPIRVEGLGRGEAADLVQALAVRGLTGRMRSAAGDVELIEPYEETERLTVDLVEALQAWAHDRGRDELTIRVGDGERAVVGPEGLDAALRGLLQRAIEGSRE